MTSDDKRAADIKRSGLIAEQAYQSGLAAGQAERDELREALREMRNMAIDHGWHLRSDLFDIMDRTGAILAAGRVT
jgi:hypothetical protein